MVNLAINIILALVLLSPDITLAAITATSNKCKAEAAGGATSVACTMPGNTTAGNFLAVCVSAANATESNFQSVSDATTSGTRRSATWGTLDGQGGAIFDIQNITAKTTPTITVNFAGSYSFRGIVVQEFSSVATSNAYDQGNVTTASNDTTPSSGNVTTTQAAEVLFGCNINTDGAGDFTPADGTWTEIDETAGAAVRMQAQYKVVSSTGTYDSPTNLGATDNTIASIATYKEASSSTTPNIIRGFGVPGMNSFGIGGPLP